MEFVIIFILLVQKQLLAIHAISLVANAAVIVLFVSCPLRATQAQICEATRTVQDKCVRCDEIIIMTCKDIGRRCRVMKKIPFHLFVAR
jgi:hypothetical protein